MLLWSLFLLPVSVNTGTNGKVSSVIIKTNIEGKNHHHNHTGKGDR